MDFFGCLHSDGETLLFVVDAVPGTVVISGRLPLLVGHIEAIALFNPQFSALYRQNSVTISGFPLFDILIKGCICKLPFRICAPEPSEEWFLCKIAGLGSMSPQINTFKDVVTVAKFFLI